MAADPTDSDSATPLTSEEAKAAEAEAKKNHVYEVVFGSLLLKPRERCDSQYPGEFLGQNTDQLYVCQWCFKYTKEPVLFVRHLRLCPLRDSPPPGERIYKQEDISIYALDGAQHKLYAQNLSLFGKLFLGPKHVFYEVTGFMYYLLVLENPVPAIPNTRLGAAAATSELQVVGFFSKEKLSWGHENLACICVFPPWQKKGLGQVLMAASYELGRHEQRAGPEGPLSDSGHAAYHAYWSKTLSRVILNTSSDESITIADLREETAISSEHIYDALNYMKVLEYRDLEGQREYFINKAKVRAWLKQRKINNLESPINMDALIVEEMEEDEDEDEEDEDSEE
ncbi:SAS complex subunit [Kalmusia sp. IMI 367209]|nr:SAS complex subunit [Kalmusia sp. IMI 367209]